MYELFEKPLNQQCSYSWYDPGHNTLFFGYYYSGWWPIFHTLIKGHDSSEVISNIYISSVYYHGFCLHFSIPWKWELIKTKKKGQQWKAGKKVWSEEMWSECEKSVHFQASVRNVQFGNQCWPFSCECCIVFPWLLPTTGIAHLSTMFAEEFAAFIMDLQSENCQTLNLINRKA